MGNEKVVEFMNRINMKLKARRLSVDCSILVLEDLYKFEEMLDTEPAQVEQVFEPLSYEVSGTRWLMNNRIHDQTDVIKLSPSIQQVFDYFSNKISEDSELMEDKINEKATKEMAVHKLSSNFQQVPNYDSKIRGCSELMEVKFGEELGRSEY